MAITSCIEIYLEFLNNKILLSVSLPTVLAKTDLFYLLRRSSFDDVFQMLLTCWV